jgi:hypothetical protein
MGQIPLEGDHWGGMVHVRRIAALIVLTIGFSVVFSALANRPSHRLQPVTRLDPLVSPDDSEPLPTSPSPRPWSSMGARLLYPYSIIPGGVRNSQELKIALANDPVAAAHYEGFDSSRARILVLDHDRMAYVSYRLNSRIYWTNKKLKLNKGETLLTDGAHLARTRCGNRISDVPAAPVSRAEEPAEEAIENPADPALLAVEEPPFALPMDPPPTTQIEPPGGKIFIPPIFPIWPGSNGTPSAIIGAPPPPPPSTTASGAYSRTGRPDSSWNRNHGALHPACSPHEIAACGSSGSTSFCLTSYNLGAIRAPRVRSIRQYFARRLRKAVLTAQTRAAIVLRTRHVL